jgi:hypothetical protein
VAVRPVTARPELVRGRTVDEDRHEVPDRGVHEPDPAPRDDHPDFVDGRPGELPLELVLGVQDALHLVDWGHASGLPDVPDAVQGRSRAVHRLRGVSPGSAPGVSFRAVPGQGLTMIVLGIANSSRTKEGASPCQS